MFPFGVCNQHSAPLTHTHTPPINKAAEKCFPPALLAQRLEYLQGPFDLPDLFGQGVDRLHGAVQFLAAGHQRVHPFDTHVYGLAQAVHGVPVGLDVAHAQGRHVLDAAAQAPHHLVHFVGHLLGQALQLRQHRGVNGGDVGRFAPPQPWEGLARGLRLLQAAPGAQLDFQLQVVGHEVGEVPVVADRPFQLQGAGDGGAAPFLRPARPVRLADPIQAAAVQQPPSGQPVPSGNRLLPPRPFPARILQAGRGPGGLDAHLGHDVLRQACAPLHAPAWGFPARTGRERDSDTGGGAWGEADREGRREKASDPVCPLRCFLCAPLGEGGAGRKGIPDWALPEAKSKSQAATPGQGEEARQERV
ncbi:Receptor activity-modifying protein 3 [Platysternon megacephalum]|uniref:Receptor activity-modifying protein 3 n=1 Tax=Platysternon megacephalum TaxID=55544 RepID=A0A4D9DP69_9SAUR|nr:Receptor activity-modifying protein 3 [Platysternon megacephalum]